MPTAKELIVKPIAASSANDFVKRLHYSGKVVPNSQLHLGVFFNNRLEGVMQFGPSMDKRKTQGLVRNTGWNDFIELNRMAFSDRLPRNSESRAIGVAIRIIKKHYPHIKWIISFADATQCGDGAIYRAGGFVLTGINKNKTLIQFPDGTRIANMTLTAHWDTEAVSVLCRNLNVPVRARSISEWKALGGREIEGFQLRYVYFISKEARNDLTVPVVPFTMIEALGATMYLGKKRAKQAMASSPEAQRQGGTDPHAPKSEQV